MSDYTMTLQKVCKIYGKETVQNWFSSYNLTDFLTPEQIQTITKFNVWSKEKLSEKIVNHYYMREIGFETPELFEHYAKFTMQEIMEEYLLKIYTKFLEYDPLSSVDYVEEYTREIENTAENKGNSSSNSTSNAEGFNINNDTPQGNITKQNLESGIYASQVNQNDNNNEIEDETSTSSSETLTNSNSGSSNQTESYTKTTKGNSGVSATAQALIMQYRNTIRAVDREIIENLNDLFMGLY